MQTSRLTCHIPPRPTCECCELYFAALYSRVAPLLSSPFRILQVKPRQMSGSLSSAVKTSLRGALERVLLSKMAASLYPRGFGLTSSLGALFSQWKLGAVDLGPFGRPSHVAMCVQSPRPPAPASSWACETFHAGHVSPHCLGQRKSRAFMHLDLI